MSTGLPPDPKASPNPEGLDRQTAELLYRQIRSELSLPREERDSVEKLCEAVLVKYSARSPEDTPTRKWISTQNRSELGAFFVQHINKSDLDAPAAFDILKVCLALFARLAQKNKAYGNSALKPRRIFAKSDTVEQIYVRMDDKINRLVEGTASGEDPLFDLVGYWVILQVALSYQEE